MDPELFNQNPSLRMSEKYKKGKIKRVPARYVYENTPLIIKDDSVQKMLIKEKGFLL